MVSYNTRQKKLVLELMENSGDSLFSCDEITVMLSENGTPVGKTTVYRQLERLVQDKKIKKIYADASKSYVYQYVDEGLDCHKHMHLRCMQCGKYVHLGCDFMNKVNEHISSHHDFTVDNSNTEIVGICGKCSSERGAR